MSKIIYVPTDKKNPDNWRTSSKGHKYLRREPYRVNEKFTDKQDQHLKSFARVEPKSFFTIDDDEVKALIKSKIGKGRIERRHNKGGNISYREYITVDKEIGIAMNKEGTKMVRTKKFVIHYSKKGIHAYPCEEWKGK